MYFPDMAAKKKRPGPAPSGIVQVQFRFPPSLIEALDRYTEKLNKGREWPLLSRSDVVRGVLQWAVRTEPDWEDDSK